MFNSLLLQSVKLCVCWLETAAVLREVREGCFVVKEGTQGERRDVWQQVPRHSGASRRAAARFQIPTET